MKTTAQKIEDAMQRMGQQFPELWVSAYDFQKSMIKVSSSTALAILNRLYDAGKVDRQMVQVRRNRGGNYTYQYRWKRA